MLPFRLRVCNAVISASVYRPTKLLFQQPTNTRIMSSIVDKAKTTLSENFGGAAQKAAPDGTKFSLEDVPDQSGKVAVVTGGSRWYPESQ